VVGVFERIDVGRILGVEPLSERRRLFRQFVESFPQLDL